MGSSGHFLRITQLDWNKRTGEASKVGIVHVPRVAYDAFLQRLLAVMCLENRAHAAAIAAPSPKARTKSRKAKK